MNPVLFRAPVGTLTRCPAGWPAAERAAIFNKSPRRRASHLGDGAFRHGRHHPIWGDSLDGL